jgi:hypothetical protein
MAVVLRNILFVTVAICGLLRGLQEKESALAQIHSRGLPAPSPKPTIAGASFEQRGKLSVPDHCSVALDTGKVECALTFDGDGTEPLQHPRGKGWDFWYEASGKARLLRPQNRTIFASAPATTIEKAGCQTAPYKRGPLRIDRLPVGSQVCVRDRLGRYAELTMEKPANSAIEPLKLASVLWQ